jgi:phosphatidate cytidylyltransferase
MRMRILSAAVLAPLVVIVIGHGGLPFLLFVLGCIAVALHEWFYLATKTDRKLVYGVLGTLYIMGTLFCCFLIRDFYSANVALLFIAMIWSSDIGAFFAGKIVGGPKMAASISPNKTWAGFAGAAISPAIVGLAWIATMHSLLGLGMADLSYYFMVMGAGVAVGIAGQAGDLLVSFVKRKAGVKDSGQLIPGHGGLLDRVDGMMLAAPLFLLFAGTLFYAP